MLNNMLLFSTLIGELTKEIRSLKEITIINNECIKYNEYTIIFISKNLNVLAVTFILGIKYHDIFLKGSLNRLNLL